MVKPKVVWRKVFGRYAIGALVVPNENFKKMNPSCYVWVGIHGTVFQRIPTTQFVGRILGYVSRKGEKSYYIRWIADKRDTTPTMIWTEGIFNEL